MTQKIQIGDTVRDMTADEIAIYETSIAESEAWAKAETDKAKAKTALLDKLGITAEEAALLLS